ncbi:unnamed protein product [Sphagnum balticum]
MSKEDDVFDFYPELSDDDEQQEPPPSRVEPESPLPHSQPSKLRKPNETEEHRKPVFTAPLVFGGRHFMPPPPPPSKKPQSGPPAAYQPPRPQPPQSKPQGEHGEDWSATVRFVKEEHATKFVNSNKAIFNRSFITYSLNEKDTVSADLVRERENE